MVLTAACALSDPPGGEATAGPAGPGPPSHMSLTLFDGRSVDLSIFEGSVVLLNFWASWCPPCRQEMPAFERVWQEYRDRGVVFIGIAVSDTEEEARGFADEVGVTYPLALDPGGRWAAKYGAFSLPTTVLVDRRGVEARTIRNAANEAVLRIFLDGMLEGG